MRLSSKCLLIINLILISTCALADWQPAVPYMKVQEVWKPEKSPRTESFPKRVAAASMGVQIDTVNSFPELGIHACITQGRAPQKQLHVPEFAYINNFGAFKIPGWSSCLLQSQSANWVSNTMTFESSGQTIDLTVSRLAPAVMAKSSTGQIAFFGGSVPAYYCTSNNTSASTSAGVNGVTDPNLLSSAWILTWFGPGRGLRSSHHPLNTLGSEFNASAWEKYFYDADCPFLLIPGADRTAFDFWAAGVGATFTDPNTGLIIVPLYGETYPKIQETSTWQTAIPQAVIDRCNSLADILSEFPTNVTETYAYDPANDIVSITEQVEFTTVRPGGRMLATIPPILAIAAEYGFKVTFSDNIYQTGVLTSFGPYCGILDTDTYTWHVRGLAKYVNETRNIADAPIPPRLTDKLTSEVSKMIDAGHLAIWKHLVVAGKNYASGERMWFNPGDQQYHMLQALDLLEVPERTDYLAYLADEYNYLAPYDHFDQPLEWGASREYWATDATPWTHQTMPTPDEWPPEPQPATNHYVFAQYFGDAHKHPSNHNYFMIGGYGTWGESRIPTRNLYAVAEYLKASGTAPDAALWQKCRDILAGNTKGIEWASLGWFQGLSEMGGVRGWEWYRGGVLSANSFFTGCIGYLRITDMMGQLDEDAWGYFARVAALRYVMGKYPRYLYDNGQMELPSAPDWSCGYGPNNQQDDRGGRVYAPVWTGADNDVRTMYSLTQYGMHLSKVTNPYGRVYMTPFIHICPELGRFFKDYLRAETAEYVKHVEHTFPDWYMAKAESTLGGDKQCYRYAVDPYQIFMVRSLVLDAPPDKLEECLDIPWTARGDLFYLERLAETAKRYRGATWPETFFAVTGVSFDDDPATGIAAAYDEAFSKLAGRTPRFALVHEGYCYGADKSLKSLVISEANGLPVYGACFAKYDYTIQSSDKGFMRKKGINVTLIGGNFQMQAETIAMGPVDYGDPNTLIANRTVPAATLGARFNFGHDNNLLYVTGSLHNPEITYFAEGLNQSVPDSIPIIGGAHYSPGHIYTGASTMDSAALAIRISGEFLVAQSMAGPYWQAQNNPDVPPQMITDVLTDIKSRIETPDLAIGFICASLRPWSVDVGQQYMDLQHQALVNAMGPDCPYLGAYAGGEMGRTANLQLTAGGAYVSMLAVKAVDDSFNYEPEVDAGPNKQVSLPPGTTNLEGAVSDDGLPLSGQLTTFWTQQTGPAQAIFADANSLTTMVTFPLQGVYEFSLTASDGDKSASDTVTITVNYEPPQAWNPNPPDGAINAATNVILTWSHGKTPITQNIYFGLDSANLPLVASLPSDQEQYDPCDPLTTAPSLALNTTYYWRIDTISGSGTAAGDLWTFTTVPVLVDPNLICYWNLDENSGPTAYDLSGNRYDGTLTNGASWAAGKFNSAVSFDGSNDYIDCGDADAVDGQREITVALWAKVNALDRDGTLIAKGNYTSATSFTLWRDDVGYSSGRTNSFSLQAGDGTQVAKIEGSTGTCADNNWHHVAFTFEGGSTTGLRLYIDGIEDPAGPAGTANIFYIKPVSTDSITVGQPFSQTGKALAGLIDDVRIYDYALTPQQIQDLANAAPLAAPLTEPADLNADTIINLKDFAALANYWLWTGVPGQLNEDLTQNGTVDNNDLSNLANEWLNTAP